MAESRRNFIRKLGSATTALPFVSYFSWQKAQANTSNHPPPKSMNSLIYTNNRSNNSLGNGTVKTPGISSLPYEMDGSVKVFRLVAEPVTIKFPDMSDPMGALRRPIFAWGYNGSVIGPTIEAIEGDHVRIIVQNNLPDPTTVHWHGLHVFIEMDGVEGISQEPIPPGASFTYEFTLEQHGTYFYHPHFMGAKQVGMGMVGFFIIHPKNPEPWQIVDHDYTYLLQTWMIHPGSPVPDTMEMSNFNFFTMNGRAGPDITPMQARSGEKVRIRCLNLSMLTHPVHLHGHTFKITEYGAGFLPESQHIIANTINISSAEVRTLEFTAGKKPGKWMFHCHFMHHVMNDMHRTPIPGAGSGHAGHQMGGMSTWIEVTA